METRERQEKKRSIVIEAGHPGEVKGAIGKYIETLSRYAIELPPNKVVSLGGVLTSEKLASLAEKREDAPEVRLNIAFWGGNPSLSVSSKTKIPEDLDIKASSRTVRLTTYLEAAARHKTVEDSGLVGGILRRVPKVSPASRVRQFEKEAYQVVTRKKTAQKSLRRSAPILALALASCSKQVEIRPPLSTEPAVSEVAETPTGTPEPVSTPTVLPSTEVSRGKYGVEGGPAHGVEDPNTYNLEELVTEEDWEKIKIEVRIKNLENGKKLMTYSLPWGCEVQEDDTNSQKFISVNRELHPDVHDVEVAAICDLNPDSPTYGTVPTANYKKFSLDQLAEGVEGTPSASKKEAEKSFRGVVIDQKENSLWRVSAEDYEIIGDYPGVFQGWVEKSSVPGASDEKDVRYGRWANSEGMGIVEFKEVKEGEYYGGILMDEEGNVWRMVDEDYELTNNEPGNFGGWIEDESIPADERKDGIRWGKWSNPEGFGRVRFEKVNY